MLSASEIEHFQTQGYVGPFEGWATEEMAGIREYVVEAAQAIAPIEVKSKGYKLGVLLVLAGLVMAGFAAAQSSINILAVFVIVAAFTSRLAADVRARALEAEQRQQQASQQESGQVVDREVQLVAVEQPCRIGFRFSSIGDADHQLVIVHKRRVPGRHENRAIDSGNRVARQHPNAWLVVDSLSTLIDQANDPRVLRISADAALEALRDPELDDLRRSLVESRRAPLRQALERAVAREELDPDLDLELTMDLLTGPVVLRGLVARAPLEPHLAEQIVDRVFGPMPALRGREGGQQTQGEKDARKAGGNGRGQGP